MPDENVKTKRIQRMLEDIQDFTPEQREYITDRMLGLEEDELEQKKVESEIVMATEFIESSKTIADNWGKVTGLRTGYAGVDSLTKGLDPGALIIVAGRTSQNKTTLSLNIAINVARQGAPILFVSLENTKEEIVGKMRKICTSEEDFESVVTKFALQSRDEMDWRSVDRLIEGFVDGFDNSGLVVIDHLHYFSRETQNTAEALGVVTKEFKKNAIRHKIPVILISHVRKDEDKGKGKLPTIEALRGSSLIAQDADIVLMVGNDGPNSVIVEVQKNRNKGFDYDNPHTYLRKDPNGARIY